MKKIPLYLFALLIISFSCKQKNSTSGKTTDSTKTNSSLKMPDLGGIVPGANNNSSGNSNNTTSGGSHSWSKDFRTKFVSDCVTKAQEKVTTSQAVSYCECMTDKVEAKYPNETEVNAKLTNADIDEMKQGCLPGGDNSGQNNQSNQNNNNNNPNPTGTPGGSNSGAKWSYSDQKEFMDNCVPGATKSLGSGAQNYCECMMNKIMQEYPNSQDAGKVTKEHMTELARQCLGK